MPQLSGAVTVPQFLPRREQNAASASGVQHVSVCSLQVAPVAQGGVPAAHPHALRHSFGTALAEAGVDLAVLQALMGHDHVDSSAAYIHLAPAHVRAAYDAARERQRAWQESR